MHKARNYTILYFTPAICWGILIGYFSLMPGKELPHLLQSMRDYVMHFGIYTLFGWLLLFGANQFSFLPVAAKKVNAMLVAAIFMGIGIEFCQENFIPGRHYQFSDVCFNTLGLLLMWPLNWAFKKRSS